VPYIKNRLFHDADTSTMETLYWLCDHTDSLAGGSRRHFRGRIGNVMEIL
jgi:hypothetical protein